MSDKASFDFPDIHNQGVEPNRTGVLLTGFGAILAKHEPNRNRYFETFENRTGTEPNESKNIEP